MIHAITAAPVALRLRALWLSIVLTGVVAPLLVFGVAYAIGGFGQTTSQKPYAVIARTLPDGAAMHVHGVVMVILGLWIVYGAGCMARGSATPRDGVRRALRHSGNYCWLAALSFACAPLVPGGAWNYAWVPWSIFGIVAHIAYVIPPPSVPELAPPGADARP